MESRDVVVVGAGISGASFAHHAARAGHDVLVLERGAQVGGCLRTVDHDSEFWFELGGHTFYNSYGATIEILEQAGAMSELLERASPVLRFLRDGGVLPGKNLGLLLRQFRKFELLASVPRWIGADKSGKTLREHFSRLVGKQNYARVLSPMLSAVPSQCADEFPAELLFKKRPRRKDVPRSFTFKRGSRTLVECALGSEKIETRLEQAIARIERDADGFVLTLEEGASIRARKLALAVPPQAAAKLLEHVDERLARALLPFEQTTVDSLGVVLPRAQVKLPEATFFIPLEDSFHSIVTRDVVPDEEWRAFTLHFRAGLTRDARIERAAQVLGIPPVDLSAASESRVALPSPRLGHAARVKELDHSLASGALALTGNWFEGLSIEDCVSRSKSEWLRIASAR